MKFQTTIVSAFVTGVNKKKNMDYSTYIEYGKKLLVIPVPKLIFVEKEVYDTYFSRETYPLTEFVIMNSKTDIYLYSYISKITRFEINSSNPDKDTIEYLFVQCNKTEWIRQAISKNPFQTEQFTWIDFGIYHIVKNESYFHNAILKISRTIVKKVSVGNCWNLRLPFVRDIYKDVAWFFAGGIFGGESQYLLEFADLVQQKCIEYIQTRRSFIWETNIWYLIYKEHLGTVSDVFYPYLAEHNVSLLQNYGNTTESIVLVSAVFKNPLSIDRLFSHLYFLADIQCPMVLFVDNSFPTQIREFITKTYSNIYVSNLGEVSFPWNSPVFLETAGIQLPSCRNIEKDTYEHMWNMHSKIFCLEKALEIYPHNPFSFLWVDYTISDICSKDNENKPVQTFLYELSIRKYIPFPYSNNQMILPGCWSKVSEDTFFVEETKEKEEKQKQKDENKKETKQKQKEKQTHFINNISWRFCGNVLWGNPTAIRTFRKLYDTYFRVFLKTNRVLTWEVNFWAWLETTIPDWNPIWYSADHNDSLFYIPSEFICCKLGIDESKLESLSFSSISCSSSTSVSIEKTDYPLIYGKEYSPMSASYLYIPEQNKHYLNTRFINYRVMENGNYWWASEEGRTIRTKNIFSELSAENLQPICFREMRETTIPNYKMGGLSEGIEDIRLFYNGNGTDIQFIGSTYNHSPKEKIQMIIGKYDIELGECTDTFIVDSPSWCEKNWIPIFSSDSDSLEPYFIYKWYPMEIGRIRKQQLEICITHSTISSFVFRNIRGSSCFIKDTIEGTEGFVGVVHYSEDRCPTRHYFHRLVLLDKHTFKPLKYTDAFYFCNLTVEFCIGFTSSSSSFLEKYVFWISQMDRDPLKIEIDKDKCPKWNTCGAWGK